MAEEQLENEEVKPAEVTEDDLRNLIGEVLDEKLSGISEGIGGLADSIMEKLKGDTSSEDSILEKVGAMIDEKLKGIGNGESASGTKSNGSEERKPKIRIFS